MAKRHLHVFFLSLNKRGSFQSPAVPSGVPGALRTGQSGSWAEITQNLPKGTTIVDTGSRSEELAGVTLCGWDVPEQNGCPL